MKQYNGEKAIISLTSWKARIHNVPKTIFSLLKQCPGYHIVLVLSEDEFPDRMIPENVCLLAENDIIEILWVKKNYFSFKKVLFTMDKYPNVPVISADDGCKYYRNFADELYNVWINNQNHIVSETRFEWRGHIIFGGGYGVLYPPNCFGDIWKQWINDDNILSTKHDDGFMCLLREKCNVPYIVLNDKWQRAKDFDNIKEDEQHGINHVACRIDTKIDGMARRMR